MTKRFNDNLHAVIKEFTEMQKSKCLECEVSTLLETRVFQGYFTNTNNKPLKVVLKTLKGFS
jgi:hypothetical protein